LQCLLRDIVSIIGYTKFRRYFETMGVNRVHLFLISKGVTQLTDLTLLDDLEARHLIDQIVMKTSLPEMRLSDLQENLGQPIQMTDARSWLESIPCVPED